MMSCESVRESLLEFLGEPIDRLPADLRAHLDGCAGCTGELEELRGTWLALGQLPEEQSSDRMRARFHAMLTAETASVRRDAPASMTRRNPGTLLSFFTLRPVLQAAALAAALIIGVFLGTAIGARQGKQDGIAELRDEMRSMTHAVTLSLLQHQSASERLRGVGLTETTPPDAELIQTLLRVVNDDPSANVRLAALDVLASLPARSDVRAGLIASLPHQASPPVTAAMAAVLLELDGSEAAEAPTTSCPTPCGSTC